MAFSCSLVIPHGVLFDGSQREILGLSSEDAQSALWSGVAEDLSTPANSDIEYGPVLTGDF